MQHQVEGGGLRLFFALPLPPALRETLGRWQPARPLARPSRTDGLHVTLAFLGDRSAEALLALDTLAAAVAARHAPFALRTAGLGGFPGNGRVRILWLGLAPSPALESLAQDLRDALATAGEAFDTKPFRAHITLARLRQPRPLAAFPEPPPTPFAASDLVLFESRTHGGYAPVRTWPLRRV
ncbi:RNA 2',3'-cyclic phosphodiesterase [Geothrix oryzisoli]|uniref:RNA 2',3'-cyclic phosphodiesterase n=1 Tax=Geothrix oryzisoli TaxID=2922721 RepID=UPI001FAD8B50|nr:RNA 2',3'-cyclic phosphodiesterase [Geothrix oryzisoli]